MKRIIFCTALLAGSVLGLGNFANAETVIDFNDFTLPASSFYNGDSGASNSDGWSSAGAFFENNFTQGNGFSFWNGWSYSNVTNTTIPGSTNQYASFPGGGATIGGGLDSGGNYAVASGNGGFVNLPGSTRPQSVHLTNATYAAIAIRDGVDRNDGGIPFVTGAFGSQASINDQFYSASLNPDGNDFFRITMTGYNQTDGMGSATGSLTRYLADYRDDKSDNPDATLFGGADYVLGQWIDVDLTALGNARSFDVTFETTDIGSFGPNTPFYAAIDNLTLAAVPEPSSIAALAFATAGILATRRRRNRTSRSNTAR